MIEFGTPTTFLLFPLLLFFLILAALRSRSVLSRGKLWISLCLRSLLTLLLVSAIARPVLPEGGWTPARTLFLLDVSESIPDSALEESITYIEAESAGQPSALIVFAGHSKLIHSFSPDPIQVPRDAIYETKSGETGIRKESLAPSRTDYASALRLASTLEPPPRKLVLLTDGRDPLGSFPHHESPSLKVIGLKREMPDAAVIGIRHPLALRTGEPFNARVDVVSSIRMKARVILQAGKQQWKKENLFLPAGPSMVFFQNIIADLPGGPNDLQAFIETNEDGETRNNYWSSPIIVAGRPRILILEESPESSRTVVELLGAHQFDVQRVSAKRLEQVPLDNFNAVISIGLGGNAFSEKTANQLRTYVENGGGFWFIARPDPAAGIEYAISPIADLLPVTFDKTAPSDARPEPMEEREAKRPSRETLPAPTIALLLVVDKSGSMAGRKLELVKEACRVTGQTLTSRDSIGVLAFDANPHWVLKFTSPSRTEHIRDRIYRLLADGGTDIYPALVEAQREMTNHPRARAAGIRHIILFSDGDTREADFRGLVSKMSEDGITVSTVCILRGRFDPILMNDIAHVGKGRFSSTGSFSQIPKIFTEEARALLRETRADIKSEQADPVDPDPVDPAPVERFPGTILPTVNEDHEILWEKIPDTLPTLSGVLKASAKKGARTPLGVEGNGTLLSIGRVGLGKVAVWTSDLSGVWSSRWIRWIPFGPELFAQLVRHLSDSGSDLDFASRVSLVRDPSGDRVRITPGPLQKKIRLLRIHPSRKEIPLSTANDGTVVAEIPRDDSPGTYRLLHTVEKSTENLSFTLSPPYEAEYHPPFEGKLQHNSRPPVSDREKEKESILIWFLIAALAILPFDAAIRRWR